MKKLLISILIVLLLSLCFLAVSNGIKIGGVNILGVSEIKNKSQALDENIEKATKLASTDYPNALTQMETDMKKLEEEKKNYEDMVTVSSSEDVQATSQFQKYEIEYLWTAVGNHATSEGVVLKMDIVRGTGENNYNLNFTVNGSYIGITDFISSIENDSVLGFKIEEFKMTPGNSTTDLQATFVCKDITIKEIAENIETNNTNNQQQVNNTNTTNSTTSNTNTNTNTNANTNTTTTNNVASNTNTAK